MRSGRCWAPAAWRGFRARDTKLNRDVAIRVLLPALANDPDRLARFSREAQVLASLNHPNIAAIYGLEDVGEVRALVMELVEGETLDARLKPSRYSSTGEREGVRLEREGFSRAGLPQAIDAPAKATAAPLTTQRSTAAALLAAALVAAIVAGGAAWLLKPSPAAPAKPITRFPTALGTDERSSASSGARHLVALSPDGARLVNVANNQLFLRVMDQIEAAPIRGTNEVAWEPFFSLTAKWGGVLRWWSSEEDRDRRWGTHYAV